MFLVKFSDRLSKFCMILAAVVAFILVFIIIADIVGRNVFNTPLNGVREIVANTIVMIVFLQAGYAIRSGAMLKADFVVVHFPRQVRRVTLAVGYMLGAAFFLMIITGGWDLAVHSWTAGEYEGEGALRVPSWPTRFMILFGGGLATLNYFVMAYLDVFRPDQLDAERLTRARKPA